MCNQFEYLPCALYDGPSTHSTHTGMSDSYPSENERLISVKGVAAVKVRPPQHTTPSITQENKLHGSTNGVSGVVAIGKQ